MKSLGLLEMAAASFVTSRSMHSLVQKRHLNAVKRRAESVLNLAIATAITVTFLTLFSPFVAIAQSVPERAIPTVMKYTHCLPVSVGKQWELSPELDPDIAIQIALEDCSNEERVLYVLLSEMGLIQRDTEALLASLKFDFRHSVCVMLNDPGYLQRFQAKPHPKCVESQNRPLSK